LVTGGAGFIGSNLVHHAARHRSQWQLTVVDLPTYAGNRDNLAPIASQVEFVQGDVSDQGLIDRLVSECDVVVHFDDWWSGMEFKSAARRHLACKTNDGPIAHVLSEHGMRL
jgi:nucleoside-diphosphate-sugar epimerase